MYSASRQGTWPCRFAVLELSPLVSAGGLTGLVAYRVCFSRPGRRAESASRGELDRAPGCRAFGTLQPFAVSPVFILLFALALAE